MCVQALSPDRGVNGPDSHHSIFYLSYGVRSTSQVKKSFPDWMKECEIELRDGFDWVKMGVFFLSFLSL